MLSSRLTIFLLTHVLTIQINTPRPVPLTYECALQSLICTLTITTLATAAPESQRLTSSNLLARVHQTDVFVPCRFMAPSSPATSGRSPLASPPPSSTTRLRTVTTTPHGVFSSASSSSGPSSSPLVCSDFQRYVSHSALPFVESSLTSTRSCPIS